MFVPASKGLVALSAAALGLTAVASFSRSASLTEEPILTVDSPSATTMLLASATDKQDVLPIALQRANRMDGTQRGRPLQRMAIQGNPYENAWSGESLNGIQLETGTYDISDVDLALPAEGFPWVIGRTYNNRQYVGAAHTSNGPQGRQWHQASMPEIALYNGASDADDIIYVVHGADRFAEFKMVGLTATTFRGINGAAGVVKFIDGGGGPDTYELYDQHGNVLTFFGFDGDAAPAEGMLWKIVDPASNVAYVGNSSSATTALGSYTSPEGYISQAFDTSGRRYSYTYTADAGSTKRLTQVLAEVNDGGWVEVGRVNYEYYGNESHGDIGDLKLVEITTPLSDSGVSSVQKKYYRYWDSGAGGTAHDIKLIVDFEGTRAFDWAGDATFDEDFLSALDVDLKPYSSAYFEYTSDQITTAFFQGECGCGSGGDGTHFLGYEPNGSYSATPTDYDEAWKNRVVIERPDGSYVTQYFDATGQPLSRVVTSGDPTGSPAQVWVTAVERDTDGLVQTVATPAAVTSYTHSTGAIGIASSDGLVWVFGREGSNARFGFIASKSFQEGTDTLTGTTLEEYVYENFSRSINGGEAILYRPISKTVNRYPAGTAEVTTSDPAESASDLAIATIATENPEVAASENGSDAPTTRTLYLRDDGTRQFEVAEDEVVTYFEYTGGQLTKRIDDADDDQSGDFDDTPPTTHADAVHRITTYTYDAQGRPDTETQADGRVFKTYYSKLADGRLVTLRYNHFEAGTPTFHGPVQYTVTNLAGKVEAQATVALTNNTSTAALSTHIDETDSDPLLAMALGSVVRLSTNLYDDAGEHVEESRLYFDILASGAGSDGTNYDATFYGHDEMGRTWRTKAPHGTIQRSVYDKQGRVTQRWTGTNDSGFTGGESSGTDNMVKVEELEYDGGAAGNGYLTERTLFVQDSATDARITTYAHDLRGHVLLETRPIAPHALHKYDSLGRRTATGLYSDVGGITVGTTDPSSSTGGTDGSSGRLALTETFYDAMGRVWKTVRRNVDAADGSLDDDLESLTWYDATGRVIKRDGEQLTKTFYDRLGRQTLEFILAKAMDLTVIESDYTDAFTLVDDIVLEEHQTVYESSDSDDVLMQVSISRFHDDFGGSATTGLLDTNADNDALLVTAANLEGRAQITAFWYDVLGRVTDTVRYGTNGGSNFDRDGLSVPARSDTALRTTTAYGDDGAVRDVTDPKALIARTLYDDAGRTVATIRNYVDGTPSIPTPTTGDDDVHTRSTYQDGLPTEIWVDFDGDGTQDSGVDQVTTYTYGTIKGASAGDSKIATGHLLEEVAYPDSASSSDVVSHAYNAQDQEIWKQDQAGNIFETVHDLAGRRTALKVTNVASGFDGAVQRIATAYTSLGQPLTVTSYDDDAAGSAVNEVKYAYDGWGNITSFKQDKDGTVGGSGFYEVAYTWAKETEGRNTLRKSTATMPSGATLTYDYLSSGGRYDDAVSRVTRLVHDATSVVGHAYNGLAQVVVTDYRQPSVMWDLSGSTAGDYPDLDRFGRVTSSRWTKDLATDIDFFDVDIAYDRNSNITRVEDNVHVGFDWSYEMDGLDRLERAERGTWSGSITSQQEDQTWTLDQVGNWDQVTLDFNADNSYGGTNEYNDDRTHNEVNELTARDTNDDSSDDHTLVYDAVGNLTDDDETYEYVYDPFGRLREIENQSSATVAEYRYNGLGHMIAVHEDTDLDLDVDGSDVWFYPVHDERWRKVATFRDSDTDPKEEWVNQDAGLDGRGGSSYINGVVLRDRDADTAWTSASDGTLEERIYLCQNWRGDLSAVVYADGSQVEQVRYSPYGLPYGLPGADVNSDGSCTTLDIMQIQAWSSISLWEVRGDLNLDGDVNGMDVAAAEGFQGVSLGLGVISNVGSRRGYFGGCYFAGLMHCRHRHFASRISRWLTRDPLQPLDGPNAYQYASSSPLVYVDPQGLYSLSGGGAGGSTPPVDFLWREPGGAGKGWGWAGWLTAPPIIDECINCLAACSPYFNDLINQLNVDGFPWEMKFQSPLPKWASGLADTNPKDDSKPLEPGGTIYLDPYVAGGNTIIHELTHVASFNALYKASKVSSTPITGEMANEYENSQPYHQLLFDFAMEEWFNCNHHPFDCQEVCLWF